MDPAAEARFAESIGLSSDAVKRTPAPVRARVTPTLVLVDRTGRVLHAWEGLPPDRQASIRKSVSLAISAESPDGP